MELMQANLKAVYSGLNLQPGLSQDPEFKVGSKILDASLESVQKYGACIAAALCIQDTDLGEMRTRMATALLAKRRAMLPASMAQELDQICGNVPAAKRRRRTLDTEEAEMAVPLEDER